MEFEDRYLRIAEVNGKKISAAFTAPMPDNMVSAGKITSFHALAEFLRDTVKASGIRDRDAACIVREDSYYIRRVKMPRMTVGQLKVNIPFEFHGIIKEDLAGYYFDYAVQKIEDTQMDLILCAIRRDRMQSYEQMFRQAKLHLVRIVPDVMALQAVLKPVFAEKTEKDSARDAVVLDISYAAARLHFFSKGSFEITRNLTNTSKTIVDAIAQRQQIDIHIAQQMYEHNQNNIRGESYVSDLLDQMATEIMRVINFYNYNNQGNSIDAIYYCGTEFDDAMTQRIEDNTGLPLRPLADVLAKENIWPDDVAGDDDEAEDEEKAGEDRCLQILGYGSAIG